jgi:TLP18.3/Psb32/MOLO-1 phosphatase superfamily protein
MDWKRVLRHLLTPHWVVHRSFPRRTLMRIEGAIRESEQSHNGELRFAIEAGLPVIALVRGITPRQRGRQVFGQLGVWDTEHNSGVLIYLQLVDRSIEILADRGITAKVEQATWDGICRRMETAFRGGAFEAGTLQGIAEITTLLAGHFPREGAKPNELPDQPVVL